MTRNANAEASDVAKAEDNANEIDEATAGDQAKGKANAEHTDEAHVEAGNESETGANDDARAGS